MRTDHRRTIQNIIAFCELLALQATSEKTLQIRAGTQDQLEFINYNEVSMLAPARVSTSERSNFCVTSKVVHTTWFGEDTTMSSCVKRLVRVALRIIRFEQLERRLQGAPKAPRHSRVVGATPTYRPMQAPMVLDPIKVRPIDALRVDHPDDVVSICSALRSRIETIVRLYDSEYIWLGTVIANRIAQHLLVREEE